MQKVIVTAPDGKKYRVTAPDGATREQIIGYAKSKMAEGPSVSEMGAQALKNFPGSLGNLAMNMAQPVLHPIDTAKGMASLATGAYKNIAGGYPADDPDVAAADAVGAMYKQNYGSVEGFKNYAINDPAAALSDLASVVSLGAGLAGKAAGTAGKVGSVAGKVAKAASYADPAANIMRAAYAPVWGAGKIARGGMNLIDTVGGNAPKIAARIMADRVGPDDIAPVTEALKRKSPVPGFQRTASQAAVGAPAQTALEASERQIGRVPGGPSARVNERLAQQAQALDRAMAVHAKTPETLASSIAVRTERTGPLYEAARKSTAKVNVAPVRAIAKDIIGDNAKRAKVTQPVSDVLGRINSKTGKLSMKDAMSARDHIKDLLDKRDAAQFPEYDQAALVRMNNALDEAITKASPTYKQANETFKKLSGPVSKMQIAQAIRERLTNAKDMDSFNLALADFADEEKFIAKVTGFTGNKKFSDIFNPKELSELYAVRDEMKNAFAARAPRQRTGVQPIASEIPLEEGFGVNLLSRPIALANWLAKRLGRDIEPKVVQEMIKLNLNPEEMVAALERGAKPRLSARIEQQIQRVPANVAGPALYQAGRAQETAERNPLVIDIRNR